MLLLRVCNSYVKGLVFLRLRVSFRTFWGKDIYVWRLVFLRLGASNSYVSQLVFIRVRG